MARLRWTTPALRDAQATFEWFDEHTAPAVASRVAVEIASAARRAAQAPESFPWVGSIYPHLNDVPKSVRRVLTRSRRHVLYFRYRPEAGEVDILALRGAGQLPPSADELAGLGG